MYANSRCSPVCAEPGRKERKAAIHCEARGPKPQTTFVTGQLRDLVPYRRHVAGSRHIPNRCCLLSPRLFSAPTSRSVYVRLRPHEDDGAREGTINGSERLECGLVGRRTRVGEDARLAPLPFLGFGSILLGHPGDGNTLRGASAADVVGRRLKREIALITR